MRRWISNSTRDFRSDRSRFCVPRDNGRRGGPRTRVAELRKTAGQNREECPGSHARTTRTAGRHACRRRVRARASERTVPISILVESPLYFPPLHHCRSSFAPRRRRLPGSVSRLLSERAERTRGETAIRTCNLRRMQIAAQRVRRQWGSRSKWNFNSSSFSSFIPLFFRISWTSNNNSLSLVILNIVSIYMWKMFLVFKDRFCDFKFYNWCIFIQNIRYRFLSFRELKR